MSIINVNTIQPIGAGQTVTVNGRINGYNLPSSGDAAGAILGTDGSGNLSWVNGRMVLETSKASTSGTSIDFTGIPSWVKRITVMFSGVSLSSTASFLIQLGTSSGIESTGYSGGGARFGASVLAAATFTTGFGFNNTTAATLYSGNTIITNFSGNTWTASGNMGGTATEFAHIISGAKTLSGALTQVRITNSATGTNSFDAGSINLLLEG
jgi:hypothetical protein